MDASSILQTYLDEMGKAVMNEWFEDFVTLIQLPLSILTASAKITVATRADLEDGFYDFVEMIRSRGVTQVQRTVKAATFQGTDHIVGIYETRLLADEKLALPVFHSKMWIGCHDGAWKAIKIHNTTNETRWPILLTRLSPELCLPEEL